MCGEIDESLRLSCVGLLAVPDVFALDFAVSAWQKQMITRHNEDGSVTFIYESWDELLNYEPKWEPDADLWAKDRADQRANDY